MVFDSFRAGPNSFTAWKTQYPGIVCVDALAFMSVDRFFYGIMSVEKYYKLKKFHSS